MCRRKMRIAFTGRKNGDVRALVIKKPGQAGIESVPEPAASHFLAPDQSVLIDVKAAAVSFPDVLQSRGLYQVKPDLPFVPGAEVAGVVVEAAPGSGLEPGDRVAAMTMLGGMAERAAAPGPRCIGRRRGRAVDGMAHHLEPGDAATS